MKLLLIKNILPYAIIIFLGLVIYSNTLSSEFVFDDYKTIIRNPIIREVNIASLWKNDPFRLIGFLSFSLNYKIAGLNETIYHATNITIHLLAGISLFIFLKLLIDIPLLKKDYQTFKYLPFLVALIFVIHPIQTQAVTYVTQRFASMAAFFFISSLLFFTKMNLNFAEKQGKQTFIKSVIFGSLFTLFAILAFMTKENTFTLPFVIILLYFSFFAKKTKIISKTTLTSAPILLIGISLAIIRQAKFADFKNLNFAELANFNLFVVFAGLINEASISYLITQFRVIVYYIRLLFMPIGQNLDYDFAPSKSFFEPATLASFLLILGLIITALFLWTKHRLISFGILFFFITLAIESSIFPIKDVIYEHRLYLPSAGAIIAILATILLIHNKIRQKLTTNRIGAFYRISLLLLFSVVILLSSATYKRNHVWQNQISLWTDTIVKSPNKARPYNGLGIGLYSQAEYELAAKSFEKAIELRPNSEEYTNLGITMAALGRNEVAYKSFETALQLDPLNSDALSQLELLKQRTTHF